MIKKSFLTGLAVLLPLVITFWIIMLIVNLLTNPFQHMVEGILRIYGLTDISFFFFSSDQVLRILSKILILGTLFLGTLAIGLLGRMFITHYLLKFGDYLMHQIPIVNKVYKAIQEVVKSLLEENRQTFNQVVLVRFPHQQSYSIGLVTSEAQHRLENSGIDEPMISVFVPATPNPTMGFLILQKKSQLIFLDMGVDEALKAIISCGVIFSNLKK